MDRTRQIVFCSDDRGRAFLVTIAYTQTHAVVTDCEKIPPGYDIAMQRMRGAREGVLKLENLQMDETKRQCPFCGNRDTFYCKCGMISCMNDSKKIHACPNPDCAYVGGHQTVFYDLTSQSGFVDGPASPRALPPPRAPVPVPRLTASYWQKAKERQQRITEAKEGPRKPGSVPLLPYYKK